MESMPSQSFLVSLQTSDNNILNAWNFLVNMLMQDAIGCVTELHGSYVDQFLMRYTTTITLLGKKHILVKISGLSEKEQLLPFLAKEALLEALWEIPPLSLKGSNLKSLQVLCIPLSTEQVEQWEESPQKEREESLDSLIREIMMNGSRMLESKYEEEVWMNPLTRTKELAKSLALMQAQLTSYTPYDPSESVWPTNGNTILIGTKNE